MQVGLDEHLSRLDEIFSTRGDYSQTLRFMRMMADNIIRQLITLPDFSRAKVDLGAIADQTAFVEYYRYGKDEVLLPMFSNLKPSMWCPLVSTRCTVLWM